MSEYPKLKAGAFWLLKAAAPAVLIVAFGAWQYQRGFNAGADTTICAFAIAIEGGSAATEYDACRNIEPRSPPEIEGFNPGGE